MGNIEPRTIQFVFGKISYYRRHLKKPGESSFMALDIQEALHAWLQNLPKNFFKSITFDCGKEFSNWKDIANAHDIDIYCCDPGTPSQRPLNEYSNGLLRRCGLVKYMDFNTVSEYFVQ